MDYTRSLFTLSGPATASEVEKHIQNAIEFVKRRDPDQVQFIQAFTEVANGLAPVFQTDLKYLEIFLSLSEPERVITFKVPWVNDAGKLMINRGFRVQFNSTLGPYKGGLRFHPSVNLSILKFLGFEQIFKNSLTTLAMGGGKGGSDFDPKGKSDNEVRSFCQSFMTELQRHIGPDTDVPAGDIGVGEREIGFMYGQYKRLSNSSTGTLTGKDPKWGGSFIRPQATGYGLVFFVQYILNDLHNGDSFKGKRVAISGSGNVAQYAADKVIDFGGIPITFSDSSGYIYEPNGFTKEMVTVLMELKNIQRARVSEFLKYSNTAKFFPNKKAWDVDTNVNVALPCACENELDKADAEMLVKKGCIIVGEGANMPTTPEAISVFKAAKVTVCPGKAANAGGVAVSGLEMSQNSQREKWTSEKVLEKLQDIMKNMSKACQEAAAKYNVHGDIISGANIAGFLKVAHSYCDQGCV
ncbi:glutamate dehydrogenase (NADP+) [Babesia microti strain RI]|uniref:Glutamate dehydrogenase n=1 Tax=Babesia microti (strain RI) TaxID=1133968 RepID=A0A0K3AUK4_BABMR|nr:glutamate dehydrogenase (NADP+) [Babesia microti strain RI]CTQ41276.1 glutamate dehydrogenase (NADP+) [Babesia microti strain RI]|eukprot:XP_012649287.1 glutamate dehydrogenase (NADP+) [Babesia microti strain RI]